MADKCAKDTAHKISNGEKSAPAIVSVYDAFRISAEIVTTHGNVTGTMIILDVTHTT